MKESGAWPLLSLRQSFLDGSLTRLMDPDAVLRGRVVEWVGKGDFGLGSGRGADGRPSGCGSGKRSAAEDVMFDSEVCLLTGERAAALKAPPPESETPSVPAAGPHGPSPDSTHPDAGPGSSPDVPSPQTPAPPADATLRVHGDIPPEVWNRVGTRLLPKLRSAAGRDLKVRVAFELTTDARDAGALLADLRRILDDLQLAERVRTDVE